MSQTFVFRSQNPSLKPANPLNQQALENFLWAAATYLRGHIDAGDYMQFIFLLLFFKRICDVYDEAENNDPRIALL